VPCACSCLSQSAGTCATAASSPCFWLVRAPRSGTPSRASPTHHLFDALLREHVLVPIAGLGKQHLCLTLILLAVALGSALHSPQSLATLQRAASPVTASPTTCAQGSTSRRWPGQLNVHCLLLSHHAGVGYGIAAGHKHLHLIPLVRPRHRVAVHNWYSPANDSNCATSIAHAVDRHGHCIASAHLHCHYWNVLLLHSGIFLVAFSLPAFFHD
jgi:hypothetical protein